MDWKIVLQVGSFMVVLGTILYGQAKARGKDETRMSWMESIDKQLNNHITDLSKKMDIMHEERIQCRQQMGDRVSKMEGKLNGKI